jgi:hypothetical protein
MSGSRNRRAGHGFELTIKNIFISLGFPHVVTCRSESRSRDGEGIDLINKDEATNGRLPFNVQCKNSNRIPKYDELLNRIPKTPGVINVILHKFTCNKGNKNSTGKFVTKGHYAILEMDDFLKLVEENKKLKEGGLP